MHYVEARSSHEKTAEKKGKGKELHHLEIYATADGEGHAIQHHFENGDVEQHEFAHPAENEPALMHIANTLGMQPSEEGNGEENA